MSRLKKKNKPTENKKLLKKKPLKKKNSNKLAKRAKEIEKSSKNKVKKRIPLGDRKIISTGSTLLDLALCGGRIRGGGIPSGLMCEIYGPSSSGKTALMSEIMASAKFKGGSNDIVDPEFRLDKEYARIYGTPISKDNYHRINTVTKVFDFIMKWEPKNKKVVNVCGVDSIAALSTDLELEKGDKRGQRKAKELSEGCRKTAIKMADPHKLILFTNQEKESDYGKTTPGGKAVGYHSSLRLRISRVGPVIKQKTINGKTIKKETGIESIILVKKSSVDDEMRIAPIFIMFGIGIDDIRANLQWYKEHKGLEKYLAVDKEYSNMDPAISYIEKNNLESELREMVIDLWEEIEEKFKVERKAKVRF